MFTELVPGIFAVAHRFVDGNNGIVFGKRGAVAIDTSNYADEGQATADFIRSKGCAVDRVILTHGHGDHVLGGSAFFDAEVYANAPTPEIMRRGLPDWARRTNEPADQVLARAVWPTITFSGEMRIDLGDRRLHLFPTPGHSPDGICVYLPEDRVLFAADTAVTGIVPAIGEGNGNQLEESLKKLQQLEIDILIPGHGPVLQGRARVEDWLAWLLEYLTGVRAFVHQALEERSGDSAESIAESVSFESFIGKRLPADRNKMPMRHRNTVLKLIQEEQAALDLYATP